MGWIDLMGSAALLATADASAAEALHRDPAAVSPPPKPAPLKLTDARSRQYRSALRDAAMGPSNFAGHYVLAQIGCGGGCIEVAAIDRSTGEVVWLPGTISGWPLDVIEPLSFRRESRLLVVQGMIDERSPAATRRYLFDGKRFLLLSKDRDHR